MDRQDSSPNPETPPVGREATADTSEWPTELIAPEESHRLELREEQLVPQKELRELGEVVIRTDVEEVPGRLEVEAYREEIEIEHLPIGEVVQEKQPPWEEDGDLIVPVYEEQLVVVKRLVLREQLRIRRVGTTETRLIEDVLRRERLRIEDPNGTGLVHEQFPTATESGEDPHDAPVEIERGGLLERVVKKTFL
jgi:uncharacterized protein (TIGR02271 family)